LPVKSSVIAQTAYDRHRARAKARSAAITLAGQDIAPLPPIRNRKRRARAEREFRFFCETYFPQVFSLPWCQDHLRVIKKIERVVRHRETLAVAMPRGSGKTSLCLAAVLWAILPAWHLYVELIGATDKRGQELLESLKSHLAGNDGLLEDFPEAAYPIRMLEGESRRCAGQRYYGVPTRIEWLNDLLVLPTIPGSRSAETVIRVAGLTGHIRGALHTRSDGTQIRPTLVICDDPQTDESARSPVQTAQRLAIIQRTILGLAGPTSGIGVIVPCTVICPGDLAESLLDREKHPEWRGERTKMMYAFPKNKKLWTEYARRRGESLRAKEDISEATEFYKKHRKAMDREAIVAWPERFGPGEVSGIQCAMNLKIQDEAAFMSEYQNEPIEEHGEMDVLAPSDVAARFSGRPRGEVPLECRIVTAFIDVHDRVLYWIACAWAEGFKGYIVDYGTWPPQKRSWFTLETAPRTLGRSFPKIGTDGAIQAGLESLVGTMLAREWRRAGNGGVLRIERCLVDSGYKAGIVAAVKHKVGGATMVLSRGVGIRAGSRPMTSYRRKAGEVHGYNWYMPNVAGSKEFPYVAFDANWWKTFVHKRLSVAPGDPDSLMLFGKSAEEHSLFAEHIAGSETWNKTTGHGREVQEWRLRPSKPDNHWLDCLVGCAVAASTCGITSADAGARPAGKKQRRKSRVTYL